MRRLVVLGTIAVFVLGATAIAGEAASGDRKVPSPEAAPTMDVSFEGMVAAQSRVEEIVRADENVQAFSSSVGTGGPSNSAGNAGRIYIRLKPRDPVPVDGGGTAVLDDLRVSLESFGSVSADDPDLAEESVTLPGSVTAWRVVVRMSSLCS